MSAGAAELGRESSGSAAVDGVDGFPGLWIFQLCRFLAVAVAICLKLIWIGV